MTTLTEAKRRYLVRLALEALAEGTPSDRVPEAVEAVVRRFLTPEEVTVVTAASCREER